MDLDLFLLEEDSPLKLDAELVHEESLLAAPTTPRLALYNIT